MWESHPLTSTLHPIVDPPIVGVRRVALVLVPKLSVLLHDQLVGDVLFKSNLLEGRTPLRAFSVDGSPSRGDAHLIANQSEDLISQNSFHRKTAVASKREKLPLPAALKVKMTVSSRFIFHQWWIPPYRTKWSPNWTRNRINQPDHPGIVGQHLENRLGQSSRWIQSRQFLCTVNYVDILTLSFVRVVMNSIM